MLLHYTAQLFLIITLS